MYTLLCLFLIIHVCISSMNYPSYANHPCKRECNGQTRTCSYNLTFTPYMTMRPDCQTCTSGNETACYNVNCVPGIGAQKIFNSFNGMLPGPAIEVCVGDTVIIDVTNNDPEKALTIHWHGQHQRNTAYMDGVPQVTQCPILPDLQFRYTFRAANVGTHLYYSGVALQHADGAYGHFIVRQQVATTKKLYDFDMHVVSVTDWLTDWADNYRESYLWSSHGEAEKQRSFIVNGFGPNRTNTVPRKTFTVKRGYRYLFRLIHAGVTCPILVSIDNHKLTVVSAAGDDIEPVVVDNIKVSSTERFDFVLHATSPVDRYQIKFQGQGNCADIIGVAALVYEGASGRGMTIPAPNPKGTGLTFNCLGGNCFNMTDIVSKRAMDSRISRTPDFKYYFAHQMLNSDPLKYSGAVGKELYLPFINEISYKPTSVPILFDAFESQNRYCNYENKFNCIGTICECTHLLTIRQGALTELILVNDNTNIKTEINFHLHGYSFYVISVEAFGPGVVAGVRDKDSKNAIKRNFNKPVLVDTVNVPVNGYVVIRFIADNPGSWLLSTDYNYYSMMNEKVVIRIGDRSSAAVPSNIPRCGNYNN